VTATGIDPARVAGLKQREERAFSQARPRSLALSGQARAVMPNGVPMSWMLTSYEHGPLFVADARGSRFTDLDGHTYADFNVADMSMFCGYGPEPVTAAVAARVAAGSQFMLPTEDAVWVAAELGRRYGLPKWQFTLSATGANTEAIRVARVRTGRDQVLLFDGKYHGHLDETLVGLAGGKLVPEEAGLPADVTTRTVVIPFNDPGALRAALATRRIALVLTEPALTNNIGLLLPDDGFHAELRAATSETGTLLAYDETHTQVVGPGGLTRRWGLRPDIVTARPWWPPVAPCSATRCRWPPPGQPWARCSPVMRTRTASGWGPNWRMAWRRPSARWGCPGRCTGSGRAPGMSSGRRCHGRRPRRR